MAPTEESLAKPKATTDEAGAWESFEPLISQVLGNPMERLEKSVLSSEDVKPLAAGAVYFDQSGKLITDLSEVSNEKAILRSSVDASGEKTLEIFANKNAALSGASLLREKFSYKQDSGVLIEQRVIIAAGEEPILVKSSFDQGSSELSFHVLNGKIEQKITIDHDSNAKEFEVTDGEKKLSYVFENGKILGAKIKIADEVRELRGEALGEFSEAAEKTIRKVREANGIPEPLDTEANELQIQAHLSVDWDSLWTRELGKEAPAKFEKQQTYSHHEILAGMQYDYLHGLDPNALNNMRELCYRFLGGSTSIPGSVQPYYCDLQYVDDVGRFESASMQADLKGRHEALIDLVSLDKSPVCTAEIHQRIDEFLNGKDRKIERQELIAVFQEAQRRTDQSLLRAGAEFVQLLRPDLNASSLRQAFSNFESAAHQGNIAPTTIEWVREFALAKQLKSSLLAANTQKPNQFAVKELQTSLSQILSDYEISKNSQANEPPQSELLKNFGGPDNLRDLLARLSSNNSDRQQAALIELSDLMSRGRSLQLLSAGTMIAESAIRPQDILRLGLLTSPELMALLRSSKAEGPENRPGGEASASSAVLRLLAENPNALSGLPSQVDDKRVEAEIGVLRNAEHELELLIQESQSSQEKIDRAHKISELANQGPNSLSIFKSWTDLYAVKKELDQALESYDAKERVDSTDRALQNIMKMSGDPLVQSIMDAIGGREKLDSLIRDIRTDKPEEAFKTIEKVAASAAFRQLEKDLKIFNRLGPQKIIDSNLLLSSDALQSVRAWGAIQDLQETLIALDNSEHSLRNEHVLAAKHAIQDLLSLSRTASGRALIQEVGGEACLLRIEKQLGKKSTDGTKEDIDRVLSGCSSENGLKLKERLLTDLRSRIQAPLSGHDLLRPSSEDVARAIEGSDIRSRQINQQFDLLERQFLERRPQSRSGVEQSEQRNIVLTKLEDFALRNFAAGGDDERMLRVPEYTAINQVLNLAEAADAESTARAIRNLIQQKEIGNIFAQDHLRTVEKSLAKSIGLSLDKCLEQLESNDVTISSSIFTRLQQNRIDIHELLDNLRTRAITHDVMATRTPSASQLEHVISSLREEVNAGNKSAEEGLKWAQANHDLALLSRRSSDAVDPARREKSLSNLLDMAKSGNQHARTALFAVLEANVKGVSELNLLGYRPIQADFSHLMPAERQIITFSALKFINESISKDENLNQAEARSLAVLAAKYSETAENDHASGSAEAIRILERAFDRKPNQSAIMNSCWSAMKTPELTNVRRVADLYLRHADHPVFASQLSEIASDSLNGNDISMYVIAGALGSNLISSKSAAYSGRVVRALVEDSTQREKFCKIMLERSQAAGDQRALISTLGEVVGDTKYSLPGELVHSCMAEIRRSFDRSHTADGKIDDLTRSSYASAVAGLAAMAKHWDNEDIVRISKEISPEINASLLTNLERIDPSRGSSLSNKILERLQSQDESERVLALKSTGTLARFLNSNAVDELASFRAGTDILNQSRRIQAALGQTLLMVVANGGSVECKESAVRHFLQTGWSKELREELGPQADQALVRYAQGKDVTPELSGMISEISYNLGISPPIAQILRQMGLPADSISDRQLEQAIKRSGGEDKFRDLLARIVAYESLTAPMQEALRTGNLDLSSAAAMLKQTTPGQRLELKDLIIELAADGLSKKFEFFDAHTFDARLKKLDEDSISYLSASLGVSPKLLRNQVSEMRLHALSGKEIVLEGKQQRALTEQRNSCIKDLIASCKEGHGTPLWHIALMGGGYFVERAYNKSAFETKQSKLLDKLKQSSDAIAAVQQQTMGLRAIIDSVDLSSRSREIFQRAAFGDRKGADSLLLQLSNEHGLTEMAKFSPQSLSTLLGSGAETWQGGAWGRVFLNRYANLAELPTYELGTHRAFEDATKTLSSQDLHVQQLGENNDIDNTLRLRAHDLIVHEALRAIDSEPSIIAASGASARLGKSWGELNKLVQAGVNGERSAALSKYVRDIVGGKNGLREAVESIQQELPRLRELSETMKKTYEKTHDAVVQAALLERIHILDKLCREFAPESQQMKEMHNMFRLVESGSYDPTTFWTSMRDTMVPIAATIAFAVCVGLSFTPASPLGVVGCAALIAAGGLVIRESWAEVSYQANWRGDSGALLGNAYRGQNDPRFLVYNSNSGSFALPPSYSAALSENFIELGYDTALNLALMGFGNCVGQSLRYLTVGKELEKTAAIQLLQKCTQSKALKESMSVMAAAPAAERGVMLAFLRESTKQGSFALAQEAGHDALSRGFEAQNFMTQMTAALLMTVLSEGVSHYRNFGAAGFRPRWKTSNEVEFPVSKQEFLKNLESLSHGDSSEFPKIRKTELPNGNLRIEIDGKHIEFSFRPPS
ncbi:MAG: hypothetical protein K2X27_03455, partial [Candidatus Obscuribacterales bacterium]|nr:hypothetical protein [Candidatus Obscuribacterales bacterium]